MVLKLTIRNGVFERTDCTSVKIDRMRELNCCFASRTQILPWFFRENHLHLVVPSSSYFKVSRASLFLGVNWLLGAKCLFSVRIVNSLFWCGSLFLGCELLVFGCELFVFLGMNCLVFGCELFVFGCELFVFWVWVVCCWGVSVLGVSCLFFECEFSCLFLGENCLVSGQRHRQHVPQNSSLYFE